MTLWLLLPVFALAVLLVTLALMIELEDRWQAPPARHRAK